MTKNIFEKYVCELDKLFINEKLHVILFHDKCVVHLTTASLIEKVTFFFFLANSTSVFQPICQNIIKNLIAYYRRMLVIRMIQAINNRILANKHTASNGMNSRSRVGSVLPKLYLIAFIILDLKGC